MLQRKMDRNGIKEGEESHSRKVGRLLKIDNSNDNNNNNGMVAIGEVLPKDLSCRGCWWEGSFLLYFSVPRLGKGSLGQGNMSSTQILSSHVGKVYSSARD